MNFLRKVWVFVFLGGFGSLFAQDFTVDKYTAEVFLHAEGYFSVAEHYEITFHRNRHGIYRDIQLVYEVTDEAGEVDDRRIKVRNIEVPNHNYETSGKIARDVEGYQRIKIGDADVWVYGPMVYDISYTVENAWLFNEQNTQFYWNLKPPNWNAPFKEMKFVIHPPEGVALSEEDLKIYSGEFGSTLESNDFMVSREYGALVLQSKPSMVSHYGSSVTVLLNLPPDAIAKIEPWWPFGQQYGWTLVVGGLIALFFGVWRRHGKDDKVVPITSYYPPEQMDPALAGYIIDDTANTADLIALIPYWGAKGLIKVEEIENKSLFKKDDMRLYKLKPLPSGVPKYERSMFNGLFAGRDEVLVSSLKDKFYKTMQTAKAHLRVAAQPYYSPKARKMTGRMALVFLILMVVLFPIVLFVWNFWGALVTSITCMVLLIINLIIMRKKNAKGNEALAHLKGFRNFVKLAETPRLKSLMGDNPHYYEDTLSYALAFGLFDKWSKKFEGLEMKPPQWYSSTSGNAFNMHTFSRSFSSGISSAQSTMVSSPSSSGSGGGSSGGGFGGGGGGSW